MSGGTVNLARDFWDDTAFRSEPFTQREAFLWFVTEASWKDRPRRVGESVVNLKRGELAASVRFMAKAWQWTPAKVQRFLEKLKSSEKICLKTDTGLTVISVCKYDQYQNKPNSTDTGPIQDRYTTDTNENKGVIRGKEKKDISSDPDGFDEFWNVVPRKDAKGAARKAFKAAIKKASLSDIVSGMRAYAKSRDGQDPKYTAMPSTWLNAERWLDGKSPSVQPARTTQPDETLLHFEAEQERRNAERKSKRTGGPRYTIGEGNPQAASHA